VIKTVINPSDALALVALSGLKSYWLLYGRFSFSKNLLIWIIRCWCGAGLGVVCSFELSSHPLLVEPNLCVDGMTLPHATIGLIRENGRSQATTVHGPSNITLSNRIERHEQNVNSLTRKTYLANGSLVCRNSCTNHGLAQYLLNHITTHVPIRYIRDCIL
jgi:hypothetical protein